MDQDFHTELNIGIGKIMPLIGQVMTHARCHVSNACERLGYKLTAEEAGTLMIIYQCDGMPQSILANILGKDKASVTRVMNVLVKSGLVGRIQDEHDRRVIRAHITEEGKLAFVDILPALVGISDQALSGVSEKELHIAQKVLAQMNTNLCPRTDSSEYPCG